MRAVGLKVLKNKLSEYVRLLDETMQYFDALVRRTDAREIAVRGHAVSTRAQKLRTDMRHARSAQAIPNALTQ